MNAIPCARNRNATQRIIQAFGAAAIRAGRGDDVIEWHGTLFDGATDQQFNWSE
jgi:hypothetical protein